MISFSTFTPTSFTFGKPAIEIKDFFFLFSCWVIFMSFIWQRFLNPLWIQARCFIASSSFKSTSFNIFPKMAMGSSEFPPNAHSLSDVPHCKMICCFAVPLITTHCLSTVGTDIRAKPGGTAGLKWREVKSLSHVRLFATPWTVAYQSPRSMGFSRQKHWSGLPFPSPGDLPNPWIEPRSPTLQADTLPSDLLSNLCKRYRLVISLIWFSSFSVSPFCFSSKANRQTHVQDLT